MLPGKLYAFGLLQICQQGDRWSPTDSFSFDQLKLKQLSINLLYYNQNIYPPLIFHFKNIYIIYFKQT